MIPAVFALAAAVSLAVPATDETAPAFASDTTAVTAPAETGGEEAELLGILNEETEKATKTRLNSDYVPGIVSVLHGTELEALGATNVWEALSFVAGVQPVKDELGRPSVVVRGTYFPFNMGNIKVLVDGVPLSREASGINSFVLNMPIEQVDRIEVIRGPGSILYGDFAFMGLVNIITRSEGSGVFVRGDTGRTGWLGTRGVFERDGLTASANVAGARGFGAPMMKDVTADTEWESGVFSLGYGGAKLSAMLVNATSLDQRVPRAGVPVLNHGEVDWAVEGSYEHAFTPDFRTTLRLSYLKNTIEAVATNFDGALGHGTLEANWDGWQNQSWLAAIEYVDARIDSASQTAAGPPGTEGPVQKSVENKARRAVAGTLEDNITLGERFSIIPGARYDDYTDIGSRVTPRMAAVWRAAEHHIVKAQYSEGFRTPTFFELYASGERNRALSFETNRTGELNYIFRIPNTVIRLTAFVSRIDDMIYISQAVFRSDRKGRSYGMEGEWSNQLTSVIKLLAQASWFRSEDSRDDTNTLVQGVAVPSWMGDAAAELSPVANGTLGLHWNHVGARHSARGNDQIDLAASRENLIWTGLTLRAGVKNVLDQDILYATRRPDGDTVVAYPGRSFWAGISYGY